MQNMKLITPSDYSSLKPFFERQRYPICVYSLACMLVWTSRIYHPCGAVVGNDTLVMGTEFDVTHEERRHLMLPISPNREYGPDELYKFAKKFGFERYFFVPEDYIERVGRSQVEAFFEIEEHPEFNDYVYLREDLADLRGNKYSKKRNLISQFNREYADRIETEQITEQTAQGCYDFLEEWCKERDCHEDPEGLLCEKQAVKNSLEHIDHLEMKGILLRIDGKVNAFGIGSRVTDEMGALHFQKAFTRVKGLYQFFDKLCARELFEGMEYINKESDMGDPGLAKAKKSYHPVMIVKSYKLIIP